MMITYANQRIKLQPTHSQIQKLMQQAGATRYVYNWALNERMKFNEVNKSLLPTSELSKQLTQLKRCPEKMWLNEAIAQSLQQSLRDLDHAYYNFLSHRTQIPKFKSRHKVAPSFKVPQEVRILDTKVYCPKIGWIAAYEGCYTEGKTKGARFKRDTCGDWWVTVTTEFEIDDSPLDSPTKALGIDLGLESFITTSDGVKVPPLKSYRKAELRLKREQRKFSRKKKGSKNREKQRIKLARAHRKVARQRSDYLHKLSHSLVKQYDFIAVEDLNVKGLARTKLAKSIHDAGWGEFVRQLEYKCLWNRKHFVRIDRFAPTSKTCSVCGIKKEKMPLSVRTWGCECGAIHDRDTNAAKNILALGLKAAGHVVTACDQPSGQPTTTLGGVSVRLEALAAESSSR